MALKTLPSICFTVLLAGRALTLGSTPVPGHVEVWGRNLVGETEVPPGLEDVIAVAAGQQHSLAVRANGTVVGWGSNFSGETTIPPGLTNAIRVAAGNHQVALKADGTVMVWGTTDPTILNPPPGATNIIDVEVFGRATIALRMDGTVVVWGPPGIPEMAVPQGLTGVVEISATGTHALALKSDGTMTGWGHSASGQTTLPAGLSGIRSIEAGQAISYAVKSDYTVQVWGDPANVFEVPANATGISEISAGNQHAIALRTNGTVVAWGANFAGQGSLPDEINGVTAIAAGGNHNLVVTARPRLIFITPAVSAQVGQQVNLTVSAAGGPLTYQWQHSGTNLPGATSASLVISPAGAEHAGAYSVIVSNVYGYIRPATSLAFPPPTINSQPVGRTVYRGEDVTLTVSASGLEPLTYQWMHSGTNLPAANSSSYLVARVGPSRTGKYRVVVTDVTGNSVTSAEAEINVIDPRPKTVVLTPSMDTSIFNSGTKPQGTSTILSGRRGNGIIDRALLRFDLASIPTNAVVRTAQLELIVVRAPNFNPYTFQLHRLLTSWDTSANWLQAAAGRQWSAPGGAPGIDFTSNNTAAVVGAGDSTFRGLFGPSPELQADLQAWIQNPSTNAGWILICASEAIAKSARHFGSAESANPARLSITYEIPATTPDLVNVQFVSGDFRFWIEPEPGWFYTIETRERLDQGNWTVLTNIAAGAALNPLTVSVPGANPHQFFRAFRN